MRRLLPALSIPIILTTALVQTPLAAPITITPAPYVHRGLPHRPQFSPSDFLPHSYMVYGLKIGPNGMIFTDRRGNALPVPSQPHIITNPETAPRISVPSLPLFRPEYKSPK